MALAATTAASSEDARQQRGGAQGRGQAAASRATATTIAAAKAQIALAEDTILYYRQFPRSLDNRPGDEAYLFGQLKSLQPEIRVAAARAIGRLETPTNVRFLTPLLRDADATVRSAAARAIAQALHKVKDPIVMDARAALTTAIAAEPVMAPRSDSALDDMLETLGGLLDDHALEDIETILVSHIGHAGSVGAYLGLEALTRHYTRAFHDATVAQMRGDARGGVLLAAESLVNIKDKDLATANALVSYRCKGDTAPQPSECGWEFRRLGVLMINPADSAFFLALDTAAHDSAYQVRWETLQPLLRAVPSVGSCQPLVNAFDDPAAPVVIRAIDLVRPSCVESAEIAGRLRQLANGLLEAEAAPPWQVGAHALIALAKLSPEQARQVMKDAAFSHPAWQVRAAAATVAAILKDEDTALRLTQDRDPNVRNEALIALRTLKSPRLFDAAMRMLADATVRSAARDMQLIRTAADSLKGTFSPVLKASASKQLMNVLDALTQDGKDTSRDGRLAILERLTELVSDDADTVTRFEAAWTGYLSDFDPQIASAAADLLLKVTGTRPDPTPAARPPEQPSLADLTNLFLSARPGAAMPTARTRPAIVMDNGDTITLTYHVDEAPIAVARFQALVASRYYNGLTFHRVVPGFVIQGGSPDANEYQGADRFARDELGLPHVRGAVGLSTRGLDTADMQIFIDLVDVRRLDHEYTVFASVTNFGAEGPIDRVLEGARIRTVR